MKLLLKCVVLIAFLGNINVLNAQLLLPDGQSYEFGFDSLPLKSVGEQDPSFSFSLGPFPLSDPAPSLLVELFEDNFSDTPFFTNSFVASGFGGGFATFGSPVRWEDLQGKIRFTAHGGNVSLSSFYILTWSSGNLYDKTFIVPEPSSALLGCAGIVFLLFLGRKRLQAAPRTTPLRPALLS